MLLLRLAVLAAVAAVAVSCDHTVSQGHSRGTAARTKACLRDFDPVPVMWAAIGTSGHGQLVFVKSVRVEFHGCYSPLPHAQAKHRQLKRTAERRMVQPSSIPQRTRRWCTARTTPPSTPSGAPCCRDARFTPLGVWNAETESIHIHPVCMCGRVLAGTARWTRSTSWRCCILTDRCVTLRAVSLLPVPVHLPSWFMSRAVILICCS